MTHIPFCHLALAGRRIIARLHGRIRRVRRRRGRHTLRDGREIVANDEEGRTTQQRRLVRVERPREHALRAAGGCDAGETGVSEESMV